MSDEAYDFAQGVDLQELLDEHDYELPEVGDIRKGVIVSISQQGVIVDLGLKRDGLVPPSDLSKLDPAERDALQVNDEIPVFVMDTEQPDSLEVSIFQAKLQEDWLHAEEMQASGELFEGEVVGYNQGGAIVEFGKLRGFIPASHLMEMRRGMNERQRQQRMSKLRGEKLPLKVIEVDRKRRRLVFSQREAQKEWQESRKKQLIENLKEGAVLNGRVSGLRNFGAFVDIGGADGLIHVSELAWHRVDHPSEVVRVGDEIEVYVLGLDRDGQRIALSRKRLLPDPWTLAQDKYEVGQLVEGRITRIVSYGAFVEIEPGIEGLLHSSQIADRPLSDPNEVLNEGETHLLRIIKIDGDRQRIGLSLKAVRTHEQIEWMSSRGPAAAEEPVAEEEAAIAEDEPAVAEVEIATAESESQAAAEAEVETATRRVVETEAEADLEPEALIEADEEPALAEGEIATADAESQAVAEPEVETEATDEVETEAEADVESEAQSETESEAEVEVDTQTEVELEAAVESEEVVEAETDVEAEAEPEDQVPTSEAEAEEPDGAVDEDELLPD